MKIGIIGAMDEEVQILKEKIINREERIIAGSEFYTGTIDDVEVVLLKSGIGKVNAAMATTLLIQLYKPDYVINTGSAGGFHKDLKVGDIVISNELRYHDVDATVFGYEYGQVPGMPAYYLPDSKLVEIAEASAGKLDLNVVTGLITSSDSFMSDVDRVNEVKKLFPNVFAAEMEATAIAQVCSQFKVPFVIIRSLSDIAGSEAKISYDQFLETASINSAKLVLSMLKEID
ncbi:5'-methylthioadenosine/S-adenosylhomocysteine nucleosidase [Vulcanibacillus modesticaldus]|uniref:5'-methylthioadenosine/S-adenosylhomocysteine nucleosidase n=1 Tax=Vulcanibacillus modesticaldus TaxID=337097 RepID=A0A1D2YUA2_9BACI|nr:5'-methylthioadenosine/S-adenosylhomocysteine nucleosidase [Vulcanibacillus modesticaldus]OEF99241.1 5'-methylthioadenosine/S-adenosylhomocysteine nucleosidase [Vulcanibacillus modesticaldus]